MKRYYVKRLTTAAGEPVEFEEGLVEATTFSNAILEHDSNPIVGEEYEVSEVGEPVVKKVRRVVRPRARLTLGKVD